MNFEATEVTMQSISTHFEDSYKAKHNEFENRASVAGVQARKVENNLHGISQHVVLLQTGGLLRWPVAYEHGKDAWRKACKDAEATKKAMACMTHAVDEI